MNRRQSAAIARRSLDRVLTGYQAVANARPPRGWIRAIRDALGMTAEQLGQRLEISQPSVHRLEQSEATGTIQLNTLKRVAEALDCEVFYALVPRQSLDETYDKAARIVAKRELSGISHSMMLEGQSLTDEDEEDRLRRFIAHHLDPRSIWVRRS